MKTRDLILSTVLLGSFLLSGQVTLAQEKTKSEKEKEAVLQETIEAQKKAMAEQNKAQELQHMEIMKYNLDSIRNSGNLNDWMRFYRRGNRNPGGNPEGLDASYVISPGMPINGLYGRGNDAERTTWDFTKHVKETSFSRDYSFDVEKTASNVVMSIIGDCKSGQINVKIIMPGGKLFSDVTIDESGNLNWRKSFIVSEDQNKDKVGEWKFKITSEKATGYFKISLQTY